MANFTNISITEQGKSLIAQAQAEQKAMNFTNLKTSATVFKKSEMTTLTDISNPKQIIPISQVQFESPNRVTITCLLTNKTLNEGYKLASYGVFGKIEGTENETLIAVTSVASIDQTDYIGASDSMSGLQVNLITVLLVSDLDVINTVIVNEGVSSEVFNRHVNSQGKDAVHGATSLPKGGQIVSRKEDGSAEINYPENPNGTSIINKNALDEALANISVGADGVPQEQIINSFKLYKEYKKGDIIAINENGTTEDWNIGNPNPTETPTQPDTPSGEDKKEESGGTESGGTETPSERVKVVTVGETIQVGAAIYEAQDDVYEDEGFTDIRTNPTKYPDIWVFKRWALS